jgi:hypothetical protein
MDPLLQFVIIFFIFYFFILGLVLLIVWTLYCCDDFIDIYYSGLDYGVDWIVFEKEKEKKRNI